MSKRFVTFGGVLILALIVVVGFFTVQKKSTSLSNPLKAIPVDAAVVIQINEFRNMENLLFQKNQIFSSMSSISPFSELTRDISYIDSLANNNSNFGDILYDSKIFISGHFIGGRKTEFLFIIQQSLGETLKQGIDLLSDIAIQDLRKTERKYEGKSIYTLKVSRKDKSENLYLAEIDGNILISRSVILIENVIRQYSLPKSLLTDEDFVEIASTSGKAKPTNLYLNLSRFSGMLSVIANHQLGPKMREYSNFGGWMELDLNVTDKQIMLNGFVAGLPDRTSFNDIFNDNAPINITVDKILPAAISSFISIGAEDFDELHSRYIDYLNALGKADRRKNNLDEFARKYGIRLEEEFLSIIDGEITFARGVLSSKELSAPSSFVLIRCNSGTQADKKILSILEKVQEIRGSDVSTLRYNYVVDQDTQYPIYELPLNDITGLLLGDLFSLDRKSFYSILGNYLIFGNSREAIGEFIYSNVLSKTLSTNEAYKSFNSNTDQKSYLLFYTNLARSSTVFRDYLHDGIIKTWEDNFDALQKIQPLGFQITEVSNRNYTNIVVNYIDEIKGKPQTVWESLLDTTFNFKPQLLENHYTKQNEIFLQDDGNTIYLINKAGRVLWKQTITESIVSNIYQIDYYKNGKLQILFSTRNYLHLLDRNGNYVERYPVRLRERATAGMALFDYEDNRNYRIFVPCADNKIYAYTKDGSIITGWQFNSSETPVKITPKHFRIEEKDFIVFADRNRTYILDRRGNIRVPVERIINKSKHNTFYLENNRTLEQSRIVTTDTAGNVLRISFDGSVETISIADFSPGHYFDYKDINADGNKDYIFIDENKVSVFNQDKSTILSFSFPNDIHHPPIYFNFSYTDRKLGVVDGHDRRIYLINQDGSLYKGFPLEGSTVFSIGNLQGLQGEFNLIVGGRNNFLYNYSVQ